MGKYQECLSQQSCLCGYRKEASLHWQSPSHPIKRQHCQLPLLSLPTNSAEICPVHTAAFGSRTDLEERLDTSKQ